MASEPRKIKGPCFDECAHGWVWVAEVGYTWCSCRLAAFLETAPTPKQPDDLRQNVPPRMMA